MVLRGRVFDAGRQHPRLLTSVLGTALAAVRAGKIDFVPGGRPVGVLGTSRTPSLAGSAVVTMATCVVITSVGSLTVDVMTVLGRPIRPGRSAAVCVGVGSGFRSLGAVCLGVGSGFRSLAAVCLGTLSRV
jgi:hypothetical protein